ncbi:MAG: glycosyltransferase [Lachnospiraceae bacterium]|nr:glycosyltransferase [Lachnospiraceae bacterium]
MTGEADVVILTYRPDEGLCDIIEKLEKQTVLPRRIILMNTEKKYLDDLMSRDDRIGRYDNIDIYHCAKEDFDHGGTRKVAAGYSNAAFLIYMTMDALPVDDRLIEELLRPFADDSSVAVSYARQLPREDASPIERYNRSFNYPEADRKKTKADIGELGIKTYFCSDVCACYRRDIYDALGGHIEHTIFNEDMIYAHAAVEAGYSIYYAAKAGVYHSHDYSPIQQYRRNIDLGRSQAEHPEVFGSVSSVGEGKKLVKGCTGYLLKNGYWYLIPEFIAQCAGRYLGYRKGKRYVRDSRIRRS